MDIHVYIHLDHRQPTDFEREVLSRLASVIHTQEILMTKVDDATVALNNANDLLLQASTGIDNIATDVTTLKQQVADLQAAGQGNTTPEFDAALQKVVGTVNSLEQKVSTTDALFPGA
jgi:flagellar hook-basal body complex protein FliE